MKRYYLAYGSNLNLSQMRRRCPNAKLTIKESPNGEVPLGIFEINENDERSLDRYEGYPTHYRKEYLNVELNGKPIKALVYVMNEDVRGVMVPDMFYVNTCLEGYKDFGFDSGYLFKAYKEAE